MRAGLLRTLIVLGSLAALAGCSNNKSRSAASGVVPGPHITPPGSGCAPGDPHCGTQCGGMSATRCAAGLYCGHDGTCTKDCQQGASCLDGQLCLSNGRCPAPLPGTGTGHVGTGTGQAVGFDGGVVGSHAPAGPPGQCHAVAVNAEPVTPIVVAIVDQSGSMRDPLDENLENSGSRWDILRKELVGPLALNPNPTNHSLFNEFQYNIEFALQIYTDDSSSPHCPDLTWMPPATGQYFALHSEYTRHQPSGSTPTREAITDSIDKMLQLGHVGHAIGPDSLKHPVIFLLATDGKPHPCLRRAPTCNTAPALGQLPVLPLPGAPCKCGHRPEQMPPGCANVQDPDFDGVEAEIERAYSLGIQTFVIELAGPGDQQRTQHLKRVANIGSGLPSDSPMPLNYFNPLRDAALHAALRAIIGGAVTCEIKLDGQVVSPNPCEGTMILNGQTLLCNDPNGWTLTTPSTVTVHGAACDTLQRGGALVDVEFPCGGVILL